MRRLVEKMIREYAGLIAFAFVVVGFIIIITFLVIAPFNDWSFDKDANLFAQYGEFIGGFIGTIFSLAGFFLIYKTLTTQQEAIKQQDIVSRQDRFEFTFFNLLQKHNEIADNIKAYFNIIEKDKADVFRSVEGRDFFIYSKKELGNVWNSLTSITYSGYYDESILDECARMLEELHNPENSWNMDPVDIEDEERRIEQEKKLSKVNSFYEINREIWDSVQYVNIEKKLNLTFGLYFQKYHYAVGHYFRHLYHILDFAESNKLKQLSLTNDPNEKKEINDSFYRYVSFLQAQMSSFELMLLYYYSLTSPKMLTLIKIYSFLENLSKEDLLDLSHDCIEGLKLKSKEDLI